MAGWVGYLMTGWVGCLMTGWVDRLPHDRMGRLPHDTGLVGVLGPFRHTLTTSLRRASQAIASGQRLITKNSTGVLSSLGRAASPAASPADPMASMLL